MASYTKSPDYSSWLGGKDAYISQTQTTSRRLIGALQVIQTDPIYVGHASERLVRVIPWSIERITEYAKDPAGAHERLNYHACALASSVGDLLILVDDPLSSVVCQGEAVRSSACKARIARALQHYDQKVADHFGSACQ